MSFRLDIGEVFFLRGLKTSRIRDQGQCSTVLAKQAWPINDLLHGVATSVFLRDKAGYCEPTMQHLSLLCSQSQIRIWIILLACEYTLPPLIHSRYYVRNAKRSGANERIQNCLRSVDGFINRLNCYTLKVRIYLLV